VIITREAVVLEAESWLGTPWHHMGRVKGVGVDCAMLLAETFHAPGLIPYVETEYYPADWHFHQAQQRLMDKVFQYAVETEERLPGNVILFHFGKCYAHAAIIKKYPICIHASRHDKMVVEVDVEIDAHLTRTKQIIMDPWGKNAQQ
jgi:cell wall-associated NlpC family hydrolase